MPTGHLSSSFWEQQLDALLGVFLLLLVNVYLLSGAKGLVVEVKLKTDKGPQRQTHFIHYPHLSRAFLPNRLQVGVSGGVEGEGVGGGGDRNGLFNAMILTHFVLLIHTVLYDLFII